MNEQPKRVYVAIERWRGSAELSLLAVGGVGVFGFVYAERHGIRELLGMSALAFIVALWYWAVSRAGALGAVAALAATAGALFWISGKARREESHSV